MRAEARRQFWHEILPTSCTFSRLTQPFCAFFRWAASCPSLEQVCILRAYIFLVARRPCGVFYWKIILRLLTLCLSLVCKDPQPVHRDGQPLFTEDELKGIGGLSEGSANECAQSGHVVSDVTAADGGGGGSCSSKASASRSQPPFGFSLPPHALHVWLPIRSVDSARFLKRAKGKRNGASRKSARSLVRVGAIAIASNA
jgi:hypothetical protein